ncbi:hypothetical protein ACA910_018631 [Epithemia clementina (nom. ined.)]
MVEARRASKNLPTFPSCYWKNRGLSFIFLVQSVSGFAVLGRPVSKRRCSTEFNLSSDGKDIDDKNRRILWTKKLIQAASGVVGVAGLALIARPVLASSTRESKGYEVQKSDAEWRDQLNPIQYEILRKGGTERPGFSILESEKRPGIFKCAGCGTELFDSKDKFNSGTGWPSFARGLQGVEIENVNPLMANFAGAELKCKTCGGHLGDVFQDGFLFVGSEAAKTGQRFCIDGAALVFFPLDPNEEPLRGDVPKKQTDISSWLEPPKIEPKT